MGVKRQLFEYSERFEIHRTFGLSLLASGFLYSTVYLPYKELIMIPIVMLVSPMFVFLGAALTDAYEKHLGFEGFVPTILLVIGGVLSVIHHRSIGTNDKVVYISILCILVLLSIGSISYQDVKAKIDRKVKMNNS